MKNLKKIAQKIAGAATVISASLLAIPAHAQQKQIDIPGTVTQLPVFDVADFVSFIIRLLIIAAFIIAFIFLLIGGIRWITAGGDPKAVEGARNMVTAALIGLVIVLAAFALIKLIEFFFGVTIISGPLDIPKI